MRTVLIAIAGMGLLLSPAAPVQAGLYNPAERETEPIVVQPGLPFKALRNTLTDLLQIGNEQLGTKLRQEYLKRRDELQAKGRAGTATIQEQVSLSAYLVRLRQYDEAINVLTPLAGRDQSNFMVFANLATACQLAAQWEHARGYLEQVQDMFVKGAVAPEATGLTKDELDWCREAEAYHLKLVRLRYRELQRAARPQQPESVDALFGRLDAPVRFVAEGGGYEAGQLAAAERQKLPKNSLAIVQQLLVWLPDDTRLYWLLGELLNAEGDVDSAAAVLDDCVRSRGWRAPDLLQHRRLVQEFKPKADSQSPGLSEENQPPKEAKSRPGSAANGQLFESRQLVIVGGVGGFLVAVLAYLQIREIRRRRQRTAVVRRG